MPKNIVVFSDGTGQEGGRGNPPTNVYKLFNMVEDRTSRQIVFYDRGLGTGWRKITGNAFGGGISHNIKECYEFIFENYQAGDQIYLFGFSRGAFTVRSLAGFIHLFGILPKSRPELIKRAYKIYRKRNPKKRAELAEAFVRKHHRMRCPIKFVGVWDTVGALGVPFKALDIVIDRIPLLRHRFHNTAVSNNVEFNYHALSLDDKRKVFQPTLWDETTVGTVLDENRIKKPQIVEQVWFAGVHTDVGGGYVEPEDPPLAALSDIALAWMVDKASAQKLHIYKGHNVQTNPDPLAELHDSRKGLSSLLSAESRDQTEGLANIKLRVHQSVVDRHNANKTYDPWILHQKKGYTVEP
jgi:uncharacterized protein (DUF2235 family)